MKQLFYIGFGWLLTVLVSGALGKLLLRRLHVRLYRPEEDPFAFLTGSACLSTLVFLMAAMHLIYKPVLLGLSAIILAVAVHQRLWKPRGESFPPLATNWKLLFFTVYLAFAGLYFFYALAPEISPDGVTYHLGVVAWYARERGLAAITTNMLSGFSEGMEMLFLFAFVWGRHSAASLVHFTFLLVLPWVILNYGRRIGKPSVGVIGGLLIFTAPLVGLDGTSAYNDVALAVVIFAGFALLEIWDEQREIALAVPIGLLAGFAFSIKYTGFIALPYAAGFMASQLLRGRKRIIRPVAIVSLCAAAIMLPTPAKNWILLRNPGAPFFNRVFPNPYVHVSTEEEMRRTTQTYAIQSAWEIPYEVTIGGAKLQGFLGLGFVLFSLLLLTLRTPAGRRLTLAALVFLVPYPANIGTRFILPAAVFVAPGIALALSSWPAIAAAILLVHAIACWPTNVGWYCEEQAIRLRTFPVRAALRLEPEEQYLAREVASYRIARFAEGLTPPGSKIFSFSNFPEAYCAREILVSFGAALNERLRDTLFRALIPDLQPSIARTFYFPAASVHRVRVVQTGPHAAETPTVAEMRIYAAAGEVIWSSRWRVDARPFPWDATFAFDHNAVSLWSAWQDMEPGMFLELDFGGAQTVERVRLESASDQMHVRWECQGQLEPGGKWVLLSNDPQGSILSPPGDLRRAAMQQLKLSGVGYLLVHDSDLRATDFEMKAHQWGIRRVGKVESTTLYRIE
ncbi:MAG: hypothetical protein DMG57_05030 [Acidobacteria bacterium]|nr:MAG: hypothetical protein DMG57_05030 [Acidobacteriota bacterium]